ncbi:sigma-70 family RNA polymerase sigma factor, partial [Actinomadura geliboluensis]
LLIGGLLLFCTANFAVPLAASYPALMALRILEAAGGDLDAVLRALPAKQRAVVVLRYWCDLSEQEIAATLGISRGTVKSHTARAMAALRKHMREDRA